MSPLRIALACTVLAAIWATNTDSGRHFIVMLEVYMEESRR